MPTTIDAPTVQMGIRISLEHATQLHATAQARGIPVSTLARMLLSEAIERATTNERVAVPA